MSLAKKRRKKRRLSSTVQAAEKRILLSGTLGFENVPDQVNEGGSAIGYVTRSSSSGTLTVSITATPDDEVQVTSATFTDGSSSAPFSIAAEADHVWDGDQPVDLHVSASGYTSASTRVTVKDVDSPELTLNITQSSVAEGGQVTGWVHRNSSEGSLTVQLTPNDPSELESKTVTIQSGSSSAPFSLDALYDGEDDGDRLVVVSASASNYAPVTDSVYVTDVDAPSLTLHLDSSVQEGGTASGWVQRNSSSGALSVTLRSNKQDEIADKTIVIPNGSSTRSFTLPAKFDNEVDGTEPVTITAEAAGYVSPQRVIQVTDVDSSSLTLNFDQASVLEGGTVSGTVTRNSSGSGQNVTLQSSDPSELPHHSVLIPSGSTSATFSYQALTDGQDDGDQPVTVTASATGYSSSSDSIDVIDIDTGGGPSANLGSARFDGVGDTITMGRNVLNHGLNDFSISAWFKTDDVNKYQTILNNGYSATSFQQHWLGLKDGNLRFHIDMTGVDHELIVDANLVSNQWYHVAVTVDRNGNALMYLNGAQVGNPMNVSSLSGVPFQTLNNHLGTLDIGRGYHHSNPLYRQPFDGQIDDVRIYQSVLTASEVNQLTTSAESLGPSTPEIAHWKLDNNSNLGEDTTGNYPGDVGSQGGNGTDPTFTSDGPALTSGSGADELQIHLLSTTISENSSTTGTVTRSNSSSGSLTVFLGLDDSSEATLSTPTVTIQSGSTVSDSFTIFGKSDGEVDGLQAVNISASASAYSSASLSFNVSDVDTGEGTNLGSAIFDGVADTITMGRNVLNHGLNDFSVSAWFKTDDVSKYQTILNNGYSATSYQQHWLGLKDGNLRFHIDMTGVDHELIVDANLVSNQWYHVAVTVDRNGNALMYLNGAQVGNPMNVSSLSSVPFQTLDNHLGTLDIGRGYYHSNPLYRQPFDGQIDDVRIYQSVLTAAEVSQLTTSADSLGPGTPEIAHWKLDNSANLGEDTTGNYPGDVGTQGGEGTDPTFTSDGAPISSAGDDPNTPPVPPPPAVLSDLVANSLTTNGQDQLVVNYTVANAAAAPFTIALRTLGHGDQLGRGTILATFDVADASDLSVGAKSVSFHPTFATSLLTAEDLVVDLNHSGQFPEATFENNLVRLDRSTDRLFEDTAGGLHLHLKENTSQTVTITNTQAGTFSLPADVPSLSVYGHEGADIIDASNADFPVYLFGGSGDDMLTGGSEDDVLYGGEGDDIVQGMDGDDRIFGEEGVDTLRGNDGDDLVDGGPGDDKDSVTNATKIFGDAGNDRLLGGPGDDALDGGPGDDLVFGESGNDYITNNGVVDGEDRHDHVDDLSPVASDNIKPVFEVLTANGVDLVEQNGERAITQNVNEAVVLTARALNPDGLPSEGMTYTFEVDFDGNGTDVAKRNTTHNGIGLVETIHADSEQTATVTIEAIEGTSGQTTAEQFKVHFVSPVEELAFPTVTVHDPEGLNHTEVTNVSVELNKFLVTHETEDGYPLAAQSTGSNQLELILEFGSSDSLAAFTATQAADATGEVQLEKIDFNQLKLTYEFPPSGISNANPPTSVDPNPPNSAAFPRLGSEAVKLAVTGQNGEHFEAYFYFRNELNHNWFGTVASEPLVSPVALDARDTYSGSGILTPLDADSADISHASIADSWIQIEKLPEHGYLTLNGSVIGGETRLTPAEANQVTYVATDSEWEKDEILFRVQMELTSNTPEILDSQIPSELLTLTSNIARFEILNSAIGYTFHGEEAEETPGACDCPCSCGTAVAAKATSTGDHKLSFDAGGVLFVREFTGLAHDDIPLAEISFDLGTTVPGDLQVKVNGGGQLQTYSYSTANLSANQRATLYVPIDLPSGAPLVDLEIWDGANLLHSVPNASYVPHFDRNDSRGFGNGWHLAELDEIYYVQRESQAGSGTAGQYQDVIFWRRASDDRVHVLLETEPNTFAADPNDAAATTALVVGNTILLTDKHQQKMEFSWPDGKLRKRIDTFGNTVTYEHNASGGKLSKISSTMDGGATTTTFAYPTNQVQVTQTVDGNTRTWTLNLTSGELTSVEYPEVAIWGQAGINSPTVHFAYSNDGVTVTDADGHQTSYQYDDQGDVLTVTNADGTSTQYLPSRVRSELSIHRDTNDANFAGGKRPVFVSSVGYDAYAAPAAAADIGIGLIAADGLIAGPTGIVPPIAVAEMHLPYVNRRAEFVDENGHVTEFETNENGHIVLVQDALGNETITLRNDAGLITDVLLPEVRVIGALTTVYQYDQSHNLLQITHPDETTERWEYNSAPSQNFSLPDTYFDELGYKTEYVINSSNGAIDEIRYFGLAPTPLVTSFLYNSEGLLERVTDEEGNITRYVYDSKNWLIAIHSAGAVEGDGDDEIVTFSSFNDFGLPDVILDPLGNATAYEYDALDRLTKVTTADPDSSGNANGHSESAQTVDYKYTAAGNLKQIIEQSSIITHFDYNNRHWMVDVTEDWGGLNAITRFDYDDVGNLTQLRDAESNPTTDFRVTNYAYDAANRLVETLLGLPNVPNNGNGVRPQYSTFYDAIGLVRSTTDGNGNKTRYGYDLRGRTNNLLGPEGTSQTMILDDLGRLVDVVDGLGRATHYAYDDYGRVDLVTSPEDGTGRTETSYTYDNVGNVTQMDVQGFGIDPQSRSYQYSYDFQYRLKTETDPLGKVTSYNYDKAGNLISLQDPNGNTTTWDYDALNRVERETNTAFSGDRKTVYDSYGRVSKTIDRNGQEIQYTYDDLHQLDKEIWVGAGGRTIDYDFNKSGQLVRVSDPSATYAFEYDGVGREYRQTVDFAGLNGGNDDVLFTSLYNANSLLEEMTASVAGASGSFETSYMNTYGYDAANRLTSIEQTNPNYSNRLHEKRVEFDYNIGNELEQVRRKELTASNFASVSDFDYDGRGRLVSLQHQNGSDVVAGYDWAYDSLSQLTLMEFSEDFANETIWFNYDDRGQLGSATRVLGDDESYSYDDNGNRITDDGQSQTIAAGNLLTFDGEYTYTYDNEGNRTSRSETGEYTEYEWDHRNRLTKVTISDAPGGTVLKTVEHEYDPFDQWIHREVTIGATVTHTFFVHRDGQIELEFDDTSTTSLSGRYLWGAGTDQLLAIDATTSNTDPGTTYWALTDHLGTVRDLVDLDGDHVSHTEYDSFGNVVMPGAVNILFGYTGRGFDSETGLQNNLFRWYDPAVGRWISEDPIGFAGGDANLYRYVGNHSTGYVDPDGLRERDNWSHYDNLSGVERLNLELDGNFPLVEAGGALPSKWVDVIVLPGHVNTRCANSTARALIRLNLKYLKQDLVNKLMTMLTTTPPTSNVDLAPRPQESLLLAANQFADLYIRSVDEFLMTHPGARPRLGQRNALLDLLGIANDKNAPWCADWASGVALLLSKGISGNRSLSTVFGVNHAQYKSGRSEHNFVIVRPFGYRPKWGTADPNILRFDPWFDLLPKAYVPKYSPFNYPTNNLE